MEEEYMTLEEIARTFDVLGETGGSELSEQGSSAGHIHRVLGRLIVQHGIEAVVVPLGEGRMGLGISPYDANRLFDIINQLSGGPRS